jgi:hypothetical protein
MAGERVALGFVGWCSWVGCIWIARRVWWGRAWVWREWWRVGIEGSRVCDRGVSTTSSAPREKRGWVGRRLGRWGREGRGGEGRDGVRGGVVGGWFQCIWNLIQGMLGSGIT